MTPERAHLGRVKSLPCVLCELLGQQQSTPTEAHHIREGEGMAQRSSDWLTAALCSECHRGPLGIHGDQTFLKVCKVSELDLLALTLQGIFAA